MVTYQNRKAEQVQIAHGIFKGFAKILESPMVPMIVVTAGNSYLTNL